MAPPKTLHGARATLSIDGKIVGLYSQVSYGVQYDVQPAYILGRHSPGELVYTAQEPVQISCTGFWVFNNGPHGDAKVPKLQDLLNHSDISISVFDRQNPGTPLMTAVGCKPQGFNSTMATRSLTEMSITYMGLRIEDESGAQGEEATAVDFG